MDEKYMVGIKRTTVYMPLSLHDDLRRLAYKRRCSMAYLLCVAVETHFSAELAEVRKDPNRAERLENIGSYQTLQERRRLEASLRELKAA